MNPYLEILKSARPVPGVPPGINDIADALARAAYGGLSYEEAAEAAIDLDEHCSDERRTEIVNLLADILTELGLDVSGAEELLELRPPPPPPHVAGGELRDPHRLDSYYRHVLTNRGRVQCVLWFGSPGDKDAFDMALQTLGGRAPILDVKPILGIVTITRGRNVAVVRPLAITQYGEEEELTADELKRRILDIKLPRPGRRPPAFVRRRRRRLNT